MQTSLIKTMIYVCAFFAVTWAPSNIYYILMNNTKLNLTLHTNSFYVTLAVGYLYICANPLIYATKFDPVKHVLLRLIPCKKTQEQPDESVNSFRTGN